MPIICPTVTAYDKKSYVEGLKKATELSRRIHIDISDGIFTDKKSVSLDDIYWPDGWQVDLHLMVQKPMDIIDKIIKKRPHLVIIHNEAEVHHMHFSALLHQQNILTGLALLQETPVDYAYQIMHSFDHVLIFSGQLGHFGGVADLSLASKISQIINNYQGVEIGWDGGINDTNAESLVRSGVDVLDIGSYFQNAMDSHQAYDKLKSIVGLN